MQTLITLTLAGSDTGPFTIYSNQDGYTTPTEAGVPRASLVAGYTATVPDGTTEVLLRSTGVCQRDLYLIVTGSPTTTTTSSTSSTSTTSTTSTTTTAYIPGPIWYMILNCLTGDYAYSQQSVSGDFYVGQIVISPGNWWTVVTIVTLNPGGSLVTITDSVLSTCPVVRYVYTVNRYICDETYPDECAATYIETFQVADTHDNLTVGVPGNYWYYIDEINSYLFEVISYEGPSFGEGLLLTNMIEGTKNCNIHCPLPVA